MNASEREAHGQKHWDAKYQGANGAVRGAREAHYQAKGSYEYMKATCSLLSTLISARNSALAKSLFGMVWNLFYVLFYKHEIKETVGLILQEVNFRAQLDPADKDVLMAGLMLLNHDLLLAKELGEELANADETPLAIKWLATARLSRLKVGPEEKDRRREYSYRLKEALRDKHIQRLLGWKTMNRLARMAGNENLVWDTAKKARSRDIYIKSLGWQIAHFLYLT